MSGVEIIRAHLPETITSWAAGNSVIIDCACGAEVSGEMPSGTETAVADVLYVMAPHLADVLKESR